MDSQDGSATLRTRKTIEKLRRSGARVVLPDLCTRDSCRVHNRTPQKGGPKHTPLDKYPEPSPMDT